MLGLRHRSESLRLIGSAMFGAILTWLHVPTTVNLGTLEDDSLQINSLASDNCFSCRNVFHFQAKEGGSLTIPGSTSIWSINVGIYRILRYAIIYYIYTEI